LEQAAREVGSIGGGFDHGADDRVVLLDELVFAIRALLLGAEFDSLAGVGPLETAEVKEGDFDRGFGDGSGIFSIGHNSSNSLVRSYVCEHTPRAGRMPDCI